MKKTINRFMQSFTRKGQGFSRWLVLIMALVMVLTLAACGDKDPVDPNTTDDPPLVDPNDTENRVEPDPIVEPEGMEATFAKYKDVYAWIDIPEFKTALGTSTDLSYPVAQHPTDRGFYLNRDLDGNNSKTGTLFTEAVVEGKTINGKDLNDPVTVIYGHNMANRTMFGGLQTFLSKMDFSQQHLVYMYQKDRRVTYQIVGGVQYDLSHIIYYHDFSNDEVFNSFFDQLWKETDGTTNLDRANKPVAGDKVLILSVCKNGDDSHRYLVVCKMIEDTADPTTWPLADTAADANKTDANKADANKTDANKTNTNKTDTNKTDTNKTDTNKTDTNKTNTNA